MSSYHNEKEDEQPARKTSRASQREAGTPAGLAREALKKASRQSREGGGGIRCGKLPIGEEGVDAMSHRPEGREPPTGVGGGGIVDW